MVRTRWINGLALGLAAALLFLIPATGNALEPEEILVLVNRRAAGSLRLGKYYMQKRGIPKKNLVKLWVTDSESCDRREYERRVATPVRKFLEGRKPHWGIRCLVTIYGMPLKVAPTVKKSRSTQKAIAGHTKRKGQNSRVLTSGASLDSELSLVRSGIYPLEGWVRNPYYVGFKDATLVFKKKDVLMVARLDGPTEEIVQRVIDDSLTSEKSGLSGRAYFDARWPDPGKGNFSGYEYYDRSIHLAARQTEKDGRMQVSLENTKRLFKRGECPETALYCGWYSLSNYVDAFTWQTGAVGYHIASGECVTLKNKNSRAWCKIMLEKGIAATIGPVAEPYVGAFPVPEIFFSFLLDGYLTLAETYMVSTPFLSWQMVLIGDPLYRPFAHMEPSGR